MKRHATMLLGLLLAFLMAAPAQAQTDVTIRDITTYPQATIDELNAAGAGLDAGRLAELMVPTLSNQEVRITAVVLSNPRTSGLGNPDADGFPSRIHVYVRDTSSVTLGNEGMGIQLVDGAYQTTGLLNAAVGDVITVVGAASVFTGNGGGSLQLSPTSVELLGPYTDFNLPDTILDPVTISSTADVNMSVGANGEVQVNWSNLNSLNGQYVRLEGAAIQVRNIAGDRPDWLITSDGGTSVIGFYDMSLRYRNDRDGGYNAGEFNVNDDDFVPPPPGASINIQGFLVFQGDDPFGRTVPAGAMISIAPFEDADLEVTASPPEASTPSKPATVPTDADVVTTTTTVTVDPSRTLTGANLNYITSVDQTVQSVALNDNGDGTFSADIPAQADGVFVIYSVTVTDNTGAEFTSAAQEYRVLNDGIDSIADLQETSGSAGDTSPFAGLTVDMNITATVMSDPAATGLLFVQSAAAADAGIIVEDTGDVLALNLVVGDEVTITAGTVQEIRGERFDRSGDVTGIGAPTLTKTGDGTAFDAIVVTTDALQDPAVAEAHESVLIRFEDGVITATNADAPAGPFGEFNISSDGTEANAFRVDDASSAISYDNNDPATVFGAGERLSFVQGFVSSSFGNYKLEPRSLAEDVGMVTNTASEDADVPGSFSLRQNYPNPFNPATTIEYTVPATGQITLEVFDMLGRSVAMLFNGEQAVGTYTAQFDATHLASGLYLYRLTAGSNVQVKKMMLLK